MSAVKGIWNIIGWPGLIIIAACIIFAVFRKKKKQKNYYITEKEIDEEIISVFKINIEPSKGNKKMLRRGEEHFIYSCEVLKDVNGEIEEEKRKIEEEEREIEKAEREIAERCKKIEERREKIKERRKKIEGEDEKIKEKYEKKREKDLKRIFRRKGNKGGYLDNFVMQISILTISLSIFVSLTIVVYNVTVNLLDDGQKVLVLTIILAVSSIIAVIALVWFLASGFMWYSDNRRKEEDRRFYIDRVISEVLKDMRKEKCKKIHDDELGFKG